MRSLLKVIYAILMFVISVNPLDAQKKAAGAKVQSPLTTSKKAVPFYFPVKILEGVTDPVRQHAEYDRYLRATQHCFQGNGSDQNRTYLAGPDSIRIQTNIVSTSSPAHFGEKMVLVLDNFVRVDGQVRYTNLCEQRTITDQELKVVEEVLINEVIVRAAKLNYEAYKRFPDLALAARAKALKKPLSEILKWIDEKDPKFGISYRTIQMMPEKVEVSDFIPYEFHLGLNSQIPGILGVTWLNAGLVYYNPQAHFFDFLVGKPVVAQHEFVHANSKLQRLPLTQAFDAETFACFPAMIYPENQLSMIHHGYTKDLRQLSKVYFGTDIDEAIKRIYTYDLAGPVDVDEKAYRELGVMIDKIKAEWMVFMEEKVIPAFYSDPMWWGALHETLNIKNAVIKIMMAINYDPVLLGGREKSMAWLSPRHDQIMKHAREVLEELKHKKGSGSGDSDGMVGVPQFMMDIYERQFSESERAAMETYVRAHPELWKRLAARDITAAMQVYREVQAQKTKKGVQQ